MPNFCIHSLRKEEIQALSGPNEFAEFYSRLRNLKDYHKKYPNEVSKPNKQLLSMVKDLTAYTSKHVIGYSKWNPTSQKERYATPDLQYFSPGCSAHANGIPQT